MPSVRADNGLRKGNGTSPKFKEYIAIHHKRSGMTQNNEIILEKRGSKISDDYCFYSNSCTYIHFKNTNSH